MMLGHVADKRGFFTAIVILAVMTPVSAVLLSINTLYSVMTGVFIFFVVGRGFMPISRSFTAARGKSISTSLGIVNFSSNIGSVVAPIAGGAMIDNFASLSYGIFTAVGLFFLSIAVCITLSIVLFLHKSSSSAASA
jgi:predicted MFS family arabinose efflux permease